MNRRKTMWAAVALLLLAGMLNGCAAVVVGGAIGAGGYLVGKDERSVKGQLDDTGLATVIEKQFEKEPLIRELGLSAYAFRGNVFIVGREYNQEQEDKAIALADQYEATKSVSAYLVTITEAVSVQQYAKDSWMTSKVKTRLVSQVGGVATEIKVTTVSGHVVLLGLLETQEEIDKAVAVAQEVNAPNPVKSFLMVDQPATQQTVAK